MLRRRGFIVVSPNGSEPWRSSQEPRTAMERLNQDFLEFIELLEAHEVEYLIVGGYAVGVHGFPRYTGDIDFFIANQESNAKKLVQVFEEFGFGSLGLTKEDFLQEDFVIVVGREPRKIQILTGIDGVKFSECYVSRFETQYEGLALKFIGKKELIRNKRASGRPKDAIDLQELLRLEENTGG
jgi:hypothetical protein